MEVACEQRCTSQSQVSCDVILSESCLREQVVSKAPPLSVALPLKSAPLLFLPPHPHPLMLCSFCFFLLFIDFLLIIINSIFLLYPSLFSSTSLSHVFYSPSFPLSFCCYSLPSAFPSFPTLSLFLLSYILLSLACRKASPSGSV